MRAITSMLLAALIASASGTAFAQGAAPLGAACGSRADIVASLHDKYGETRRGAGRAGTVQVIEVYASEETGSWTILRTGVNGLTCVMAVGDGWVSEPPKEAGDNI